MSFGQNSVSPLQYSDKSHSCSAGRQVDPGGLGLNWKEMGQIKYFNLTYLYLKRHFLPASCKVTAFSSCTGCVGVFGASLRVTAGVITMVYQSTITLLTLKWEIEMLIWIWVEKNGYLSKKDLNFIHLTQQIHFHKQVHQINLLACFSGNSPFHEQKPMLNALSYMNSRMRAS